MVLVGCLMLRITEPGSRGVEAHIPGGGAFTRVCPFGLTVRERQRSSSAFEEGSDDSRLSSFDISDGSS